VSGVLILISLVFSSLGTRTVRFWEIDLSMSAIPSNIGMALRLGPLTSTALLAVTATRHGFDGLLLARLVGSSI